MMRALQVWRQVRMRLVRTMVSPVSRTVGPTRRNSWLRNPCIQQYISSYAVGSIGTVYLLSEAETSDHQPCPRHAHPAVDNKLPRPHLLPGLQPRPYPGRPPLPRPLNMRLSTYYLMNTSLAKFDRCRSGKIDWWN